MFTVKQAADRLGVSVSLMYGLVAAKKVRHERHGLGRGVIRIPAEALDEYRLDCTVGQGVKPPAPRPKVRLRHLRV